MMVNINSVSVRGFNQLKIMSSLQRSHSFQWAQAPPIVMSSRIRSNDGSRRALIILRGFRMPTFRRFGEGLRRPGYIRPDAEKCISFGPQAKSAICVFWSSNQRLAKQPINVGYPFSSCLKPNGGSQCGNRGRGGCHRDGRNRWRRRRRCCGNLASGARAKRKGKQGGLFHMCFRALRVP